MFNFKIHVQYQDHRKEVRFMNLLFYDLTRLILLLKDRAFSQCSVCYEIDVDHCIIFLTYLFIGYL